MDSLTTLQHQSGLPNGLLYDDQNDQDPEPPTDVHEVEVTHPIDSALAIQGLRITTDTLKEDSGPITHSTRGPSLPTSQDHNSDAASVHSMPAVLVSSPTSLTVDRPSTASSVTPSQHLQRAPLPAPARTHTLPDDSSITQQQRRVRHRSAIEVRSSSRLSGFFTNLIHRRDNIPSGTSPTIQEHSSASSNAQPNSDLPSRSSSPVPGRPVTPPPPLPPPSLQELGLSLSVLTTDLSPSHFTTPPTSGAFLAPHYLLLCHAQGLDVLPLVSPPAAQPYALVRRVCFKSVVVMEQRGVLVAIAGRRDGVRVYALEEVKKAIEWRIDVEVKRERDRLRRENVKKIAMRAFDNSDSRDLTKSSKASISTPPPGDSVTRGYSLRKSSFGLLPVSSPSPPLVPRSATPRNFVRKPPVPSIHIPSQDSTPSGNPPPYVDSSDNMQLPLLRSQPSAISLAARSTNASVTNLLAPAAHRSLEATRSQDPDSKVDWVESSSDDEAIDIVAAGSSGGQALDERTSATLSATLNTLVPSIQPVLTPGPSSRSSLTSTRRNRPANLDLSQAYPSSGAIVPTPEPSPAPTLLTLRQALSHSPPSARDMRPSPEPDMVFNDAEDEENDVEGRISLAQALLESRIPDLPPLGTRRPQQPILISTHPTSILDDEPSSPRTSDSHQSPSLHSTSQSSRPRRRWSIMIGGPSIEHSNNSPSAPSSTAGSLPRERGNNRFNRSQSYRANTSQTTIQPPPHINPLPNGSSSTIPTSVISTHSSRPSRFIPRIISNAFNGRRSDDRAHLITQSPTDSDGTKRHNNSPVSHAPPPKLEYVKLPGTKGALAVKAVETAKKSFLAILCGESGEKVELFAGTYRTALGLSRTFILPDSPRSLELQLQGDDLVEVFLVFSQNVFGLEPATVRVREVRIGRAERRAARRRARGTRLGDTSNNDADGADEDINVNVSIGVSVAVGPPVVATGDGPERAPTPPLIASEHPDTQNDRPSTPIDAALTTSTAHSEDIHTLSTSQMGPYTTFQQLGFAPNFPLASIADEYIIPPTYPDFLEYRVQHEPQTEGSLMELSQTQFSPPGLPVPMPTIPSRWFYRDPKTVVHGPWKASLMQAWYKDGLLPPDLPVRREEDDEYILLKDLRLQSVDPTQPFRSTPLTVSSTMTSPEVETPRDLKKPLLSPISLLSQPRHFGPPALFFSSRGGHSTAIVDARGRSVLKSRFLWSNDDASDDGKSTMYGRMGDVKRLEAFDVRDRSILVAMRQGGLEAVDLGDALLRPADESRPALPQFNPPLGHINRRTPFVWKIGSPVMSSSGSVSPLPSKSKSSAAKKLSVVSTKTPVGRTDSLTGDVDMDSQEEVLFLGRKDDEIYICERHAGSFRILRLCPHS